MSDDTAICDLRDLIGKYFYGFAEPFNKEVIESRGVIEISLPIYKSKGHKIADVCIYANSKELDTYADTLAASAGSGSALFGLEILSRHCARRSVAGPDVVIGGSCELADKPGVVAGGINYVLKSIDLAIQSGKTYITLVFSSNNRRGCDLHFYGVFFRLEKIEK